MDKVVFDRLSSFNLNHQQKRDLIDVIKYVSKDDNFEDTFILNIVQNENDELIVKQEDVPDLVKALLDKKQIVGKVSLDDYTMFDLISGNQFIVETNINTYIFSVYFNATIIIGSSSQYIIVSGGISPDQIDVNVDYGDILTPENVDSKFKELENSINSLKKVATADANGLMSKEDKATLDALPTRLTTEQTAREQADTAINGEIQGIKDKGTLHDLFLASGATYNQDTKMYQLNGLELTTDEMVNCYISSSNIWQADNYASICNSTRFKTTIKAFALKNFNKNINASNMFSYSAIVVADLWYINRLHRCLISDGSEMFRNCAHLTSVYGLNGQNCKSFIYAFKGCPKLKDIDIINLETNISFNDSPLLSKESIVHLISNATPPSPITITLHPTAYAMATADPEIQAELEKQPNISLAEGEPTA